MKILKFTVPLVLIILTVAGIRYLLKQSPKSETNDKKVTKTLEKSDQDVLRDFLVSGHEPENEIYGAVIRLSQSGDPTALDVAKKLIHHPSKYLREGAAQALGHFADETILEDMKTLLTDKEESVRMFAIESLAVASSPLRESVLEATAKSSSLTDREKISVHASLYRLHASPEKKRRDLDNLLAMANHSQGVIRKEASLKAIQVAPEAKPVNSLMIDILKTQKDENLRAVSIRSLSNQRDPWIKEKFPELIQSSSPVVRIASLQSLHRACPPQRWPLLEMVIRGEKDDQVLKYAFEELGVLERGKATALLNKMISDTKLGAGRIQKAQDYAKMLSSKPAVDACKAE